MDENSNHIQETREESEARLNEELQTELEVARDIFDESDFVMDLMKPLEAFLPIPGNPVKIKFCRLSSAEITASRKKAEAETRSGDTEIILESIAKAYPDKSSEDIRKYFVEEVPASLTNTLTRQIISKSSVFFTESSDETSRRFSIGSGIIPEPKRTPSSLLSGD